MEQSFCGERGVDTARYLTRHAEWPRHGAEQPLDLLQ